MELLGENLSDLRRSLPKRHFSMLSTMMVAQRMLVAIREVHEVGYVHRDIKPVSSWLVLGFLTFFRVTLY
jgi:tau tubulin kinase